jgi:hypothetical protein
VLDKVDDEEDAPDVTEEQWALMASFETAGYDRAGQHLMGVERQAQREVRDMAQRAAQIEAHRVNRRWRHGASAMTWT